MTNLRLPGQYDERLLASVGLQGPYYNWNRWYLPSVGRYLELDPIAKAGGFNGFYGPNWYGYAEGNPLTYIDSLGLHSVKICLNRNSITLFDDDNKNIFKRKIVHGCDGTPTTTGKFKLGDWEQDKVSSRWKEDSARKWSEDFWGRNVFGPWFVHVVGTNGIGIHGHYGPRITDLFMMHKLVSWCSHGCIRLSNSNVQELHDLLPKPAGTPVEIVGECD